MVKITQWITPQRKAVSVTYVISPGPVLTRQGMAGMKTLEGRAADPQEIIDLVLFIASEKGQFINGENIMIDGGRNEMERCK